LNNMAQLVIHNPSAGAINTETQWRIALPNELAS
jgi:hypothetical protein